jgi:hypothetical protein
VISFVSALRPGAALQQSFTVLTNEPFERELRPFALPICASFADSFQRLRVSSFIYVNRDGNSGPGRKGSLRTGACAILLVILTAIERTHE